MHVRIQLGWLVAVTVAGLGVLTSAQTSKPAAKAAARPRVFFIEPKNNATVTSPLHMKFGAEGIEIAAVPTRRSDDHPARAWPTTMSASTKTACPPARTS